MTHKKPQPINPPRKKDPCPVCGEISYSRDGVHPQCSVKQADQLRVERMKQENPPEKKEKTASKVAPWQRNCPKCGELVHVRRKICGCGHSFAAHARPPTSEGESK